MSNPSLLVRTEGADRLPALPGPDDKCDRCGAPAVVAVLLQSNSKLMFCWHHFKIVRELESFQRIFYSMNGKLPV